MREIFMPTFVLLPCCFTSDPCPHVEGNRTWIVDGALVNPETGPGRRMDSGSRGLVRWSSCARNNISLPTSQKNIKIIIIIPNFTKHPPPQSHILRVFFEPPFPLRFRRPPPTAPALLHFNGWKYFMGYYCPGRCSTQDTPPIKFQPHHIFNHMVGSLFRRCVSYFFAFSFG